MDWPYIHTLINHFPIILTVVGTAVLLAALITRKRGVWLYALATLTLSALSVYPAHFTGDAAAHALRGTWYVVTAMVREHDDSAGWAVGSILLMGVASAYAWWYMLKRDRVGLPPVWLRSVVTVLAIAGLAIITRTAYLGGLIIHESPKLAVPAAVPSSSIPPSAGSPP